MALKFGLLQNIIGGNHAFGGELTASPEGVAGRAKAHIQFRQELSSVIYFHANWQLADHVHCVCEVSERHLILILHKLDFLCAYSSHMHKPGYWNTRG